jgi:hypothetical protein
MLVTETDAKDREPPNSVLTCGCDLALLFLD